MKRKVAKAGALRLSPNEEAQLLKEEHERRRRLRLQQVREQERNIALQIRQDVKQRRDEQLHLLAEELKANWQKAQDEKIKALEKLYLSGLRAVGEGHQQAKENEPDLEALSRQAEERKQRAEKRHKEALKKQKTQREKLLREQIWRANARRHAFQVEKERAAKIASLPPPPLHPSENVDLKSVTTVKVCAAETFSLTHHHLFDPHVDREMDTEQPDARLLAEEKAKQAEGLQGDRERERREQLEKARLRGKHALKVVRLAQDREKLMKELEQMQNIDLARRRQIVAQMPPQLFEPTYRRVEIKEEWQRELECAFEDMYTGDRRMKGDLILHLDPQPLPTLLKQSQDDDLELSQEPDSVSEVARGQEDEVKNIEPGGREVEKAPEPQSRLALKKLLNKIRNQKDQWTARDEPEDQSDMGTIESGTLSSGERRLCDSEPEQEPKDAPVCEGKELSERLDQTVVAGNMVLNHPQEQVVKIGKEAERQKQIEWLEHQKQQQLTLLQHIEEQKIRLEVDVLKAEMQQQEVKKEQEKKGQESQTVQMDGIIPVGLKQQEAEHKSEGIIGFQADSSYKENDHVQMIRDYQQRLLEQNRMHRESVEEARKRLHEYQAKLKQRYKYVSAALLGPGDGLAKLNSIPELQSRLQGFDILQKVNLTAAPPSRHAPAQEPAESSKVSSGQKAKEQSLDVGHVGQVQPEYTQVHQRTFPLTHSSKQKENLGAVETSTTQPMDCHGMVGSSVVRLQDTSATTQPVAFAQGSQFTLSADNSSGFSEKLWSDKLAPHAPLAEKTHLPTSSVTQHIPAESKRSTALDQTHLLLQPVSSMLSSKASNVEKTQEPLAARDEIGCSSTYSDVMELRDRMLASSESIQAQQEHLKELQEQLDEQREALLSRQRIQEDLLMQKHSQLKQQMEQQQEALKEFLKRARQSNMCKEMTQEAQETNSFSLLASLCKEAEDDHQEETRCGNMNRHAEKNFLFQTVGSEEQIEPFYSIWGREQKWKLSKPPLAKIKLGLDLEQHELSVIPELDTPRSGNLSTTGCGEFLTEDIFLTSNVDAEPSSPYDSLCEEADMLRITAERQSSSGSLEQLHESWQERSATEAVGLSDSAKSREVPLTDPGLPSHAIDAGRRRATHPDPSFSPNNMVVLAPAWSPDSLSQQTRTQQVACGYLSSATLSTASFITTYNPNRSLVSTEPSSANEQSRHFSSPAEEKTNDAWDLPVSLPNDQEAPSQFPHSSPSFGEMLHSNDSNVQKIIDKDPREFSWSSLSNISHDPVVGPYFPDMERNFPNFHRELFQPLEPVPDLNIFSSHSQCRISLDSKNSDFSKSRNELTVSSLEERNSSREELSNILPVEHTCEKKDKTQGAEEFFGHPPVESPLSELRQDKTSSFSIVPKQSLEMGKSVQDLSVSVASAPNKEQEGDDNVSLSSSIENFRSLSPGEDEHSFYRLVPDDSSVKDALKMTESLKEDVSSREENLCFVELPSASSEGKQEIVMGSEDVGIGLFQCPLPSVGEQSSLSTDRMLSLPQEVDLKISTSLVENSELQSSCELNTVQQPDQNTLLLKIPDSHSSQTLPVWEKLSGRGIMEEPELTLISSSDISIAESDLELRSQTGGEKEKNKNQACGHHSESKGFLLLNPEVDHSISTQPDNPPAAHISEEDWSQKPKPEVVLPALPFASLQESFLKRKKDFIERSTKRLENLKSRSQSSRKPQAKASQQKNTQLRNPKENSPPKGAAACHLKKVEVKVCSAADRKMVELQMLQRTSRLYNNLAEVKTRREEKERQDNYAKNREKAKEFQKKTLEKLRARKANVKS
uniref:Centrosomal protein of 295 kDa isoform X2 n=1 Tax=Pogona vitticeps TaxID=103695 RepID=A0A6J0VHE5_9SAUR